MTPLAVSWNLCQLIFFYNLSFKQPGERAGDEVVFQDANFNWEEVLYTVLFIFSPGRAVHSQTRLKRSESQQWWSSLKNPATEMF